MPHRVPVDRLQPTNPEADGMRRGLGVSATRRRRPNQILPQRHPRGFDSSSRRAPRERLGWTQARSPPPPRPERRLPSSTIRAIPTTCDRPSRSSYGGPERSSHFRTGPAVVRSRRQSAHDLRRIQRRTATGSRGRRTRCDPGLAENAKSDPAPVIPAINPCNGEARTRHRPAFEPYVRQTQRRASQPLNPPTGTPRWIGVSGWRSRLAWEKVSD